MSVRPTWRSRCSPFGGSVKLDDDSSTNPLRVTSDEATPPLVARVSVVPIISQNEPVARLVGQYVLSSSRELRPWVDGEIDRDERVSRLWGWTPANGLWHSAWRASPLPALVSLQTSSCQGGWTCKGSVISSPHCPSRRVRRCFDPCLPQHGTNPQFDRCNSSRPRVCPGMQRRTTPGASS